jgi:hypothetical protein
VAQWFDSVVPVFNMSGRQHVDNLIVVTHGLTMRLILMHLGGWSPSTFHSVWNADNCNMYVLARDLTLVGITPYAVAPESDKIRSSTFVHGAFMMPLYETKSVARHSFFGVFPSLSRACLGRMMHYIYKNGAKVAFWVW